jgi:isopenicillin N synthase-like dioxygenase
VVSIYLSQVVTNGRVPASVHRVRTPSNRERFSLVFGSWSREGEEVSAMDELIDGENPLLYNPCRPDEYI